MAGERLWLLLPRPIRRLPADLAAVIAFVMATDLAVLLPVVRETPARIVLGIPFVLFLPGYAFVAALFPAAGERPPGERDDQAGETGVPFADAVADRGIDGIERLGLSFGLSIAIVPLIGLVLNFTPWGIRLLPVLMSVSGFTVLACGVAAVRRWALPETERFSVPYGQWSEDLRSELLEPDSRMDAALNVALVITVVLALTSVTYAVAVPKQPQPFTEFYVLTENETGDLVASGYPSEFERGESRPLVVGIGNREHEPLTYTVVVELQRVRFENDSNETRILEQTELDRFQARLAANETWQRSRTITPTMTGERLRLRLLLYRGEAPASADAASAYRDLHLWINVTAA